MTLKLSVTRLLDRLDKYIDRRVSDDGPDWEYTKLAHAIADVRNEMEKEDETTTD